MKEGCSIISSGGKKEKKKRKKRKRSSDTDCNNTNSNSIATNSTNTTLALKVDRKKHMEKKKSTSISKYPYRTDYNDHFETPARAYDDIYPLLEYVLTNKQKCKHNRSGSSNEATIYDPYYCAGRAGTLLNDLFQRHKNKRLSSASIRIQHEKRDFYKDTKQKTVPNHDILVTNPPYSEDHKERCLEFAVNQLKEHGRPFFLLMPNYIAMKEYFRTIVLFGEGKKKRIQTFYITPSKQHQYEYDHPEGTGHKVSPFASVWFIGLSYTDNEVIKSTHQVVMDAFTKFHTASSKSSTPQIVSSLQNLIRIGAVSAEKRKNPRQRKKMKQQAMQRAAAAASGSSGVNISNKQQQSKKHKRKPAGDRQKDESTKSKKRKIR